MEGIRNELMSYCRDEDIEYAISNGWWRDKLDNIPFASWGRNPEGPIRRLIAKRLHSLQTSEAVEEGFTSIAVADRTLPNKGPDRYFSARRWLSSHRHPQEMAPSALCAWLPESGYIRLLIVSMRDLTLVRGKIGIAIVTNNVPRRAFLSTPTLYTRTVKSQLCISHTRPRIEPSI